MGASENVYKSPKTYWRDIELPTFNTLNEDLTVDVAIIGAGIAGITSAYLLSKEGVKVALIEARSVLRGTTSHPPKFLRGLLNEAIEQGCKVFENTMAVCLKGSK